MTHIESHEIDRQVEVIRPRQVSRILFGGKEQPQIMDVAIDSQGRFTRQISAYSEGASDRQIPLVDISDAQNVSLLEVNVGINLDRRESLRSDNKVDTALLYGCPVSEIPGGESISMPLPLHQLAELLCDARGYIKILPGQNPTDEEIVSIVLPDEEKETVSLFLFSPHVLIVK